MSAGTEQQPVAAPGAREPDRTGPRIGVGVAVLHLAALWAFAAVQPLFDLLGGHAQFFVARGSTAADIVLFAVALTVVPPALMAGAVWLAGRVRPEAGWWLHVALVGVLAAAILLPPAGDLMGGSALSVPVALALGAALAAAYATAAGLRTFVSVLSPAPLLFLLLFLAFSPVAELVLPAGGAVAVAGPGSSDTPVVVVVFDELPTTTLLDARGGIDAERFPAFASVAADATWYRDATTVAGRTTEAVPALLTGLRPRQDQLPTARHHPRSLFTLLGRSHRLAAVEPITDVCPRELCAEARPGLARRLRALASDLRIVSAHLLLPDDLREGLPPIDQDWQGFGGQDEEPARVTVQQRVELRRGVGRALEQEDAEGDFARIERAVAAGGSRPPFLFLHTSLPHAPWRYLPDGGRYDEDETEIPGLEEGEWVGAQWLADQGFQRHVLQTQYADRLLGALLRRLREAGLYERALVVVTADHGVSFWQGDRRRKPTSGNLGDVASVPLFVKEPGRQESRLRRGAVRTIDLLPTIARALGLRLQGPVDGVPAGERDSAPDTPIEMPDSYEGGTTGTFGEVVRQRGRRERYERALLRRAGNDPYAIGPRPDLVGRRAGSAAPVRARIVSGPPWVTGKVRGLREGTPLAIAVGGRIAATTRVDGSDFRALVPPDASGRVAVLEIRR